MPRADIPHEPGPPAGHSRWEPSLLTICCSVKGGSGTSVVAALLDQFGVLGLDQLSLTPLRMAGIATLILGTVLVTVR